MSAGSKGRHGRTRARESAADAALRRRAVRLSVLPAGFVAVLGSAVVAYVLARRGGVGGPELLPAPGTDRLVLWCVLAGGLALVTAVVVGAAHYASSDARATSERYAALRRATARSRTEAGVLLRGLEQGETARPRTRAPLQEPPAGADALEFLTYELALTHRTAEDALAGAATLVRSSASGSEEKVEVFVNLARRLQSLVHREIEQLDELENQVEDPDLLKGLFHVDHLATRIRRHAENLAVLGGAVSRRQWSRPVTTTEVLRSAIAEVEQYSRVKLVPPIEGNLQGHAVADVIHLLAELVENATVFSAPQTQVLLRAQYVTSGLAIEVEDRGLGMSPDEQNRMNAVLSDPDRIDVGELLQDGRIGLFVVSSLARRHGIVVQLQNNIYGGIQAVLVLPRVLLGGEAPHTSAAAPGGGAADTAGTLAPAARAAAATAEMARARELEAPAGAVRQTGAGPQEEVISAHRPEAPAQEAPAPETPTGLQPDLRPHPSEGAAAGQQSPPPLPRRRAHRERRIEHAANEPPEMPVGGAGPGPPSAARPSGETAGDEGECTDRPLLPRRRRQEHLAPELRRPAPAPRVPEDDADRGHDPGLMASFQRGTSLAYDSDAYDDTGGRSLHDLGLGESPDHDRFGEPAQDTPFPAPAGDISRPAR